MAATVHSHHDRVGILLDHPERDVLIEPRIARNLADALDIHSMLASVTSLKGPRDPLPTVDIESVLAGDKPMVRLKFGRRVHALYLPPQVATQLAQIARAAADDAESKAPGRSATVIAQPSSPALDIPRS